MMGRGGKREVTIPGRLETTSDQLALMAEYAKNQHSN
jgi:isoquinoline 1-oxidoreductase beta subunit